MSEMGDGLCSVQSLGYQTLETFLTVTDLSIYILPATRNCMDGSQGSGLVHQALLSLGSGLVTFHAKGLN